MPEKRNTMYWHACMAACVLPVCKGLGYTISRAMIPDACDVAVTRAGIIMHEGCIKSMVYCMTGTGYTMQWCE